MPLLIELKAKDKIIINGAVIENISNMNTKLMLHNRASILREREILAAEDASTPASRIYYDLQCAYVFKEQRAEHMEQFRKNLNDYIAACPSAMPIAKEIDALIESDNYYKALKKSKEILLHEANTLKSFNEALSKLLEEEEGEEAGAEAKADDHATP